MRSANMFPGFLKSDALLDPKQLMEWLTTHLAELPEKARQSATYDSFRGILSYEVDE